MHLIFALHPASWINGSKLVAKFSPTWWFCFWSQSPRITSSHIRRFEIEKYGFAFRTPFLLKRFTFSRNILCEGYVATEVCMFAPSATVFWIIYDRIYSKINLFLLSTALLGSLHRRQHNDLNNLHTLVLPWLENSQPACLVFIEQFEK